MRKRLIERSPRFLVLKLRGSYLEQISHLEASVAKLELSNNASLAEHEAVKARLKALRESHERFRDTIEGAEKTLTLIKTAFE